MSPLPACYIRLSSLHSLVVVGRAEFMEDHSSEDHRLQCECVCIVSGETWIGRISNYVVSVPSVDDIDSIVCNLM